MTREDVELLRGLLTLAEKDANTPGLMRLCTLLDQWLVLLERDAGPNTPPPAAAQVKPPPARPSLRRRT